MQEYYSIIGKSDYQIGLFKATIFLNYCIPIHKEVIVMVKTDL